MNAGGAPLTGSLDTVALADVLQLLDLGRKSGVLAVDGGDGRRGLVRLAEGSVTAARYQDAGAGQSTDVLLDAVAALLALPAGRFTFTGGAWRGSASGQGSGVESGVRVEALLMAAFHRADEASRRPQAPTPIPVLAASEEPPANVALRAVHWAVLAAVDGVRDTGAVAELCGRDRAAVDAALADLARAGLLRFAGAPNGAPHGGHGGHDVPSDLARSSVL